MTECEISRIVKTLQSKNEKCYVYMLCDQNNIPFYVGKGTNRRVLQHECDADAEMNEIDERLVELREKINKDKQLNEDEKKAELDLKSEQIKNEIKAKYKKISEIGIGNVKKVIVKWGLTTEEAFMAESALINAYRLTNGDESLTNIVNGHMSEAEKSNVACTTKAWTLEEFLNQCAVEEKNICDLQDTPVMFVKINATYPECKNLDSDIQDEAIYDCARAAWHIGKDKIKYIGAIKYVFALYESQVVGIYPVNEKSWTKRKDVNSEYNFPKYPIETRKRELKYVLALSKCNSINEAEQVCNQTPDLDFDEFKKMITSDAADTIDNKPFESWFERVCFIQNENAVIEKHIADFKNKLIKIPNGTDNQGNALYRGFGQNESYNFDIVDGKVKIKEYSESK